MANEANAKQAHKNRNWQEAMSNSAHQRQVKDLKAAGLNPMLSAVGSGASVPGGAQANMESLGDGISKGIETAIGVKSMNKELELKDAQVHNTHDDSTLKTTSAMLNRSTARGVQEDTEQKVLQTKMLKETLPSMIKQAKASGDYAEINQIMGVLKSGASTASDVIALPLSPAKKLLTPSKGNK